MSGGAADVAVDAPHRTGRPAEAARARGEVFALVGRLFAETYTPEGALPWFAVDGRSGRPVGAKDLLPELADYLPLLAAAGHSDFVRTQCAIVRRRLAGGAIVANPDPGLLPSLRRANPFYYSDLILGLLELHRLGFGEDLLVEARRQMETVLALFRRGDLLVKEAILPGGWRVPVSESNSLVMVELLALLGRATGDAECIALAARLARPWLERARREGAAPQLVLINPLLAAWPRFARRRRRYLLYKHNLFLLAALDALAEATGDPEWRAAATERTEAAAAFFRGPNGLFCYEIDRGRPLPPPRASLKCTLLAEHLCDASVRLRRPDLADQAVRQIEAWLDRRGDTGLIPYWEGGTATDADALTDFAVTLMKLSAATGNARYIAEAGDLLLAMRRAHLGAFGLFRSVDADTGAVLDATVETRFTSLFLKPWLLWPRASHAYADPGLLALLRDR